MKPFALSVCVSPQTIFFWVLDKSPFLGPRSGSLLVTSLTIGLPLQDPLGFPGGSAGKESACNVADLSSIPGLGRSPGEENGYPLKYFGPENSMDCIVHGVTKSQT